VLDLAFQMFWSALQPLREDGKLAMITCQFLPYFTARPANV
jgi:16S rRNA G1207 methylase RsmC